MEELLVEDFGAELTQGGLNTADTDNTTVVVNVNANANDGNASHVMITANHLEPQTLATEINNITEILYYGSSVNIISRESKRSLGNTSNTYSLDQSGEPKSQEIGSVKWLSGTEIGAENGKVILIGSTIMFSDLPYDETSNWIDQADNLGFFENLLALLLHVTPLDPLPESIQEDFLFFLRVNILAAILIFIVFLSTVMGIMIFTKRLSIDKIFAMKGKRKGISKKQKTAKTGTDEKQQKKKKPIKKKKVKKRRKRT